MRIMDYFDYDCYLYEFQREYEEFLEYVSRRRNHTTICCSKIKVHDRMLIPSIF